MVSHLAGDLSQELQVPRLTSTLCENEQQQIILRKRRFWTPNDIKQEWNHKNKMQQIHSILQNNA